MMGVVGRLKRVHVDAQEERDVRGEGEGSVVGRVTVGCIAGTPRLEVIGIRICGCRRCF